MEWTAFVLASLALCVLLPAAVRAQENIVACRSVDAVLTDIAILQHRLGGAYRYLSDGDAAIALDVLRSGTGAHIEADHIILYRDDDGDGMFLMIRGTSVCEEWRGSARVIDFVLSEIRRRSA